MLAKKWNTEKLKKYCSEIHKNKYDYSLTEYIDYYTKIKIICPIHGVFEQSINSHLDGCGCRKCKKEVTNTSEFILKANKIHDFKYDYSLVDYKNSHIKVKIICKKHGVFEQVPYQHINGSGCSKCAGLKKLTKEEFIKRSMLVHGNRYDYSRVNYINNRTHVDIICHKHGVFKQTPDTHTNGSNCPLCSGSLRKTNEEFIKRSKKIHGDLYDYSLVDYKSAHKKIIIICKKHWEFEQTPNSHYKGSGCPICKNSKGENKIINILKNNNVTYERNKSFDKCKYIKKLFFDFYLPVQNICIEYDGEQHFRSSRRFGGDNVLIKIKKRDEIKTNFCLENDIKLIRISYVDNIEEKLKCLIQKRN